MGDNQQAARTLSPSEALAAVDVAVLAACPHPVWLSGEVDQVNTSGRHLYLTLTDERTRIRAAAIGLDAQRVRGRLARAGVVLERGAAVAVFGHLRVYQPRGLVELRIIDINSAVAVGEAELERRRILEVIGSLGLAERQRAMGTPVAPLRVGIVTPGGQGWDDFEARLAMTPWAWDLRVLITPSEGPTAPESIARAIRSHSPHVDLMVVTRGGGLGATTAYDTGVVATSVCQAACPVIVAVGHNGDSPVAEKVAWRREATPSLAAVALDRLLSAQRDDLARELAAAVADAEQLLAGQTRQLEEAWSGCRIELERVGAAPGLPAAAGVPRALPAAPLGGRWRLAAAVLAAVVAALLVLVIVLAVLQ
jgi:exodeoxyribonuclease VII large subunit